MSWALNAMDSRKFVEALEKYGLTAELAQKVIDLEPLAKVTVRAIQDAAKNLERYPGVIESV